MVGRKGLGGGRGIKAFDVFKDLLISVHGVARR